MSKIAISPNVSGTGTFTIASPDSNTDRTLTLPDAGGSVVLNEGSGTFKINSSGNVGIGTPIPAYALDVQGTGDTLLRIKANSSGAGNDDDAILRFDSAETGEGLIAFYHQGVSEASIEWASATKELNIRTDAGTNGVIDFQPNNSLAMRITSTGSVGIGTSSPAATFHANSGTANTVAVFESTDSVATITLIDNSTTGGSVAEHGLNTVGDQLEIRAVDNLSFETATVERARIDASGNLSFNSGYGAVAVAYGCRAWVNFNGTGTVAIRSSGNVSSVTDGGVGTYTVNFTTAIRDANYSATASTNDSPSFGARGMVSLVNNVSASQCRIIVRRSDSSNGSTADSSQISLSVFR